MLRSISASIRTFRDGHEFCSPWKCRKYCYVSSDSSSIADLCHHGHLQQALTAISLHSQQQLIASGDMFFRLLQLCHQKGSPSSVRRCEILMAFHGLEKSSFLGDYLVSTMASCGGIEEASRSFQRLRCGSIYSWSSLISSHVDQNNFSEALHIYDRMVEAEVEPNAYTFVSLFRACSGSLDVQEGMKVHDEALRRGLTSDAFIVSAIITMYGKCRYIIEAENMFRSFSEHDSAVCNALLSAYIEQSDTEKVLEIYTQMQEIGVISMSMQTYLIMLRACCAAAEKEEGTVCDGYLIKLVSLRIGRTLHIEAEKKGLTSDLFVHSALISMYGKCGGTREAEKVFSMVACQDVVSESAMLSAYLEQGQADNVLQLYTAMQSVDEQMLVVSLQALCILAEKKKPDGRPWRLECLEIGRGLDADGRKKGFSSDIFLGTALVNMYGKCGRIGEAEHVFIKFSRKDVVLFNAMLAAYVEQGQGVRALQLYRQMQEEGVSPHQRTFVTALQACSLLAETEMEVLVEGSMKKEIALGIVQALHNDVRTKTYDSDIYICNTFINTYGKCWSTTEAENVFSGMRRVDSISWNAMFSAYMEQEQGERALQLYKQMCEKGAKPDDTTLSYLLHACCVTGSMKLSRCIHHTIIVSAYDKLVSLASMLIRTYTSCANISDAQAVFDGLDEPDVVSWTSLISGYAKVGDFTGSLFKFKQMQGSSTAPNGVTYLSVLWACSHVNLIEMGISYFDSMRDYGICPEIEHYNCMIDLLGRAGDFTRIKDMLSMMLVEPDLITWLCLLTACLKHGKVELGKHCFHNAIQIQPNHAAPYVLMSNIYTNAGLLDCAKAVDALRQKEAAWKKPGQCWIEIEKEVHLFVVGDQSHESYGHLDHLLRQKSSRLRREGHIPCTDSYAAEWCWKDKILSFV